MTWLDEKNADNDSSRSPSIEDPRTLNIRPKVITPTGMIKGYRVSMKEHENVDKPYVDPKAIVLIIPS